MKYVFWALVVYLAYQLIFNFIIPVYRTTKRIKKGFREMSARMQQESVNQTQTANDFTAKPTRRPNPDDYIEFEEIK